MKDLSHSQTVSLVDRRGLGNMVARFHGTSGLLWGLFCFALLGLLFWSLAVFLNPFASASPSALRGEALIPLLISGIVFSFLAALFALPLGLATAMILAHRKNLSWSRWAVQFFRGLSFLPSIVFGFLFCWYSGPFLQHQFQGSWVYFFRPEGWLSQILAFAFTLLCYPLTILGETPPTIDLFYQVSLQTITEFAQGSYSAVVIILSMSFFLVPTFVTLFFRYLNGSRKNRVQEAALALGMSEWEGLGFSLVHGMKKELRGIFFFCMSKAFVEGVSIFIVINYFFIAGNWQSLFWAETFSAALIKNLLFHSLTWADYLSLAAFLLVFHWGLRLLYRDLLLTFDEELMR